MREGALRGDRPRKFFNPLATIITPCSLNARIGTEECIMLANRSQFMTSSSVSSLARTNMNSYHIPVRFAIGASMSARRSSSPPCEKKVAELRVETTNAEIARLRFACRAVEGLAKVTVIWYNSRRSRMETVSQFAVASSNSDAAYA